MPTLEQLWVEKHRPRKLDELVLDDSTRATLEKWIAAGEIPHALLTGITGSGKTTIARILLDLVDCTVLALNASDDRGIETVRTRIKTFLQSAAKRQWKIVFLDEADQLTPDAQGALRNMIERYSGRARFLLTANYEEKLIEAIRSRMQTLYFRPIEQKLVLKKLREILDHEKIAYELPDLAAITNECYPDIRRVINQAQRCVLNSKLTYEPAVNAGLETVRLVKAGKLRELRQMLAREKPDFNDLYKSLFDIVAGRYEKIESPVPRAAIGQALLAIAEYAYRDALVVDREMQFAACCQQMMMFAGR